MSAEEIAEVLAKISAIFSTLPVIADDPGTPGAAPHLP